ncbi:hypothetical protein [Odoribacter sp. N15.MGS-14]|uniref:hypothetical protein n=1 Tax=Odoribacter sp. N15.MGS-14 TaxID=1637502 RepID=UPI0006239612|nr:MULTISPECIES: hypothetical protein [Odoribacter]
MKKWIFITTCTVVVLLSTVNVYRVLGDWNTPFLSMLKLEQLAYGEGGNTGGEGGGNPSQGIYSKGYLDDYQSCKVSEKVPCSISVPSRYFEWCKVNFYYTIKHEGTQNLCKYTGGPTACNYFLCKKNG